MSADHEPPWAMQLAVRAEKATPPTHEAVCEAAAMAVVALLADPRTTDGAWHEAVRHWESGPIRKVTRRARGVRWQAVQNLPGVTVDHAGAQVRAFVPAPVTEVPAELARLQVAGLDLDDAAEPTPPPMPPYAVIALNPRAPMSTGKAAAQSGHAAHLLLREGGEPARGAWLAAGLAVRLEREAPWEESVGHADVVVRDAGFTEVAPGTMTALAWIVSG